MDGIRAMQMRGGTSKGLYFLVADLPADPAERDDLLLRIMGSPDPTQIDGVGGAHPLTSKVAVVSPSAVDGVDVDYLFLQVMVDRPVVTDQQNCGNILAGVGPFAVERGLVAADGHETRVRIRMVNTNGIVTATFPTPGGRPRYDGDTAIDGVPGTAAAIVLDFEDSGAGAGVFPTGNVTDTFGGITVTCVDNGMPVVLALASSFGLTGHESHEDLAADPGLAERVDAFRTKAGALMGLGDVASSSVPKTVLLAPPADGGQVSTRSFIPVAPHTAIGVLAAVSVVTGMLLPGAVGHDLTASWPDTSRVDVEHPTGHFLVDVVVDAAVTPPRVIRSGVVRTARTLMDGVAFPRAAS
jgi:4-oxalomesaconate tautomerase